MTSSSPGVPYSVLAKPAGARCNLDCTYCFYLEKEALYPETQTPKMDDEVLDSFIQQYIAAQPGDYVTFAWQGGEPTLLGVDYYRRVIQLQKKYAEGKTIENAFQTNGLLLDDKWCELFKEGDFLIGLSIDGPEDLHDAYRLNKRGGGSFKQVMRGLEYLKKHQIEFNTLTVLHRDNVNDPLRTYNFLKSIGSRFLQFIPIVEQTAVEQDDSGLSLVSSVFASDAEMTDWSVSAKQYGHFLVTVFDAWVRQDVGKVFVQLFDSTLSTWVGRGTELCIFQETCGRSVALEHNGDIYACDHFVFPEFHVGNLSETSLSELVFDPRQVKFGQDKAATLTAQCRSCEVRPLCHGGCPAHRISKSESGEAGHNHLCGAYYQFFTHTAPYMRFMADEWRNNRHPANVVAWVHAKEQGFAGMKTGRNDPCPCGSGKKYKKCCATVRRRP